MQKSASPPRQSKDPVTSLQMSPISNQLGDPSLPGTLAPETCSLPVHGIGTSNSSPNACVIYPSLCVTPEGKSLLNSSLTGQQLADTLRLWLFFFLSALGLKVNHLPAGSPPVGPEGLEPQRPSSLAPQGLILFKGGLSINPAEGRQYPHTYP